MKIEDTITITEAARVLNISRQAVHNAVRNKRIAVLTEIAGVRLLSRADVMKYKPRAKDGTSRPTAAPGDGQDGRRTAGTGEGARD